MPDEETQLRRTQEQRANDMFRHEDLWLRFALRQIISLAEQQIPRDEVVKILKDETDYLEHAA